VIVHLAAESFEEEGATRWDRGNERFEPRGNNGGRAGEFIQADVESVSHAF
jgi:hypothetical protein